MFVRDQPAVMDHLRYQGVNFGLAQNAADRVETNPVV